MLQGTVLIKVCGNAQIMIGKKCLFVREANFCSSATHAINVADSKRLLNPDQCIFHRGSGSGKSIWSLKGSYAKKDFVVGLESVGTDKYM